tara:strand:- start:2644 stop:3114 length:471 start_codon:yes stop_codon:yes gene_type:complete
MSQVKIIFIFFSLINACNYNFQDNSVDKIEIQTSWNNTDEYPSTPDCDKLTEKKLRINCFNSYLSDLFTQKLLSEIKSVNSDINDTILIELTINNEGVIIFDKISGFNDVINSVNNLDEVVDRIFDNFPKVLPATKTNLGIYVSSKIKLPIILKSN